jgi:hypothetical protein
MQSLQNIPSLSVALELTIHIDGPELGLDEELEGGGKDLNGLSHQNIMSLSIALDLTVLNDGSELVLDEELEGGGKVLVGILLAGCLTKIYLLYQWPSVLPSTSMVLNWASMKNLKAAGRSW